jgi:hypothetical protein
MKISEIIYSVVVMICLTWAVYTVATKYAPAVPEPQRVEQELIEINRVETNGNL